jgi:hypothetical protein
VNAWLTLHSMAIRILQEKPPIHPSIVTFCSNCTSSSRCVAGRFWCLSAPTIGRVGRPQTPPAHASSPGSGGWRSR